MQDGFHILGSGAKAVVYLGMNAATGGFVAVKELHLPSSGDSEEAASILGEVQRLQSLNHPNIVGCYGARASGDCVHIVLEFCAGGSVARIIRHFGALREDVCRRYTRDVVRGLAYLHGEGICHRDVKPENLLLTVDGTCKLGDLGSSKPLPAGGLGLATCVGTPQYMAPEVISGGEDDPSVDLSGPPRGVGYGTAADIWSLGCCVYEMVVGRPFITGSNPMAIMCAVTSRASSAEAVIIPESVDVSSALADFVTSCLRASPRERATATTLLEHPWLVDQNASANGSAQSPPAFLLEDVLAPREAFGGAYGSSAKGSTCTQSASGWGPDEGSRVRTSRGASACTEESAARAQRLPTTSLPLHSVGRSSNEGAPERMGAAANIVSYSSADFEPIPQSSNATLVSTPTAHNEAHLNASDATAVPQSAEEDQRPSSTLLKCQYCRDAAALFECDECRNVFGNMYCLCSVCWPKVHGRLAASSAHRHAKRPILTSAPYSLRAGDAFTHHTPSIPSALPRGAPRPHSASDCSLPVATVAAKALRNDGPFSRTFGGGVLLSNGAFVDLSPHDPHEESGWSCGACGTFNSSGTEACYRCGQCN